MTRPVAAKRRAYFWMPAALLSLLVLLAMGRLAAHEFVEWDDPFTIAANPAFNAPRLAKIARYWWTPDGSLYVPLTYSVWGALAFIGGVDRTDPMGSTLNPWVFHGANVLIHMLSTLMVFAVLRAVTGKSAAAFFGALIFGIHPVQVETVAWASGTKDLLCGLFIAATILAVIRYRQNARAPELCWAWIATLLACLSKPTGIVAPLMAGAVDVIFLATPPRRSIAALSPALAIALLFAVIGKLVQPPISADIPPLWIRPMIASDALAFYLAKLVWPGRLAIDYGRTPFVAWRLGAIFWTWLFPLLAAAGIWRARRRTPLLAAGAVVALLGVTPVLGIVPFTFQSYSTVADHYLYPSMIGVAMMIAALSARFDFNWARAGLAVVAILLGARSFAAGASWADSQSLFTHTLAINPRSFLAFTNRAVDKIKRGDNEGAADDLHRAIAINPDYAFAHLNLAQLLLKQSDAPSALLEFRQVLRIYSTQRNYDRQLAAKVGAVIASMLARRGDYSDAAQALDDARKLDPGNKQLAEQLEVLRGRTQTSRPAGP